jgi:pyrroloquinoline quinone biosynthesis protein D
MAEAAAEESWVPRLREGVRLRFDQVRGSWVLLAPERLFLLDEQAAEILRLVDGARSLGAIADDLARRFDAPRAVILADTASMLADLRDKGAIAP